jgi:hypothetical protein
MTSMPATTSRLKRPRRRILRGLLWLVALAAAVCALAVVHMYRQGHFFRYANPSQWMLRWQGRYGFDARKGILRQAATKSRIVALTFDDGPHTSSPLLLDVLKGQGAHATFFLVGANVVKYPEIAKRMLAEGNDVGNHTRTHLRLPALRDDQVRAEIENDTIVIGRATGHRVRLFRPPGGQYDDRVTAEAQRQGMLTVLWSNNTGVDREPRVERRSAWRRDSAARGLPADAGGDARHSGRASCARLPCGNGVRNAERDRRSATPGSAYSSVNWRSVV